MKVCVLATRISLIVLIVTVITSTRLSSEDCQNAAVSWMNFLKTVFCRHFLSCGLRCLPWQGLYTITWSALVNLDFLSVSMASWSLTECLYIFPWWQVILYYKQMACGIWYLLVSTCWLFHHMSYCISRDLSVIMQANWAILVCRGFALTKVL